MDEEGPGCRRYGQESRPDRAVRPQAPQEGESPAISIIGAHFRRDLPGCGSIAGAGLL